MPFVVPNAAFANGRAAEILSDMTLKWRSGCNFLSRIPGEYRHLPQMLKSESAVSREGISERVRAEVKRIGQAGTEESC